MKIFKRLNENDNLILLKNLIYSYIIKGLALVVAFALTPAYIKFFNDNMVLGIWFALYSLLNWIVFFDFGVGNGLRNRLASSIYSGNKELTKKYISSAFFSIIFFSGLILIAGNMCIILIDWNSLLNIDVNIIPRSILISCISTILCGFCLNFIVKLVNSIYYAIQKTIVPNLLSLISQILLLMFLIIFESDDVLQKLVSISKFTVFAMNAPFIVAGFYLFSRDFKGLFPSYDSFNLSCAKSIMSLGGSFFFIQLFLLMINTSNEMFISYFYNAKLVVEYQIYSKVFLLIITLETLVTQPFWSNVTKAYINNNTKRIRNLFICINVIASMFFVVCVCIYFKLQYIANLWLKNVSIDIDDRLAFPFIILVAIELFINASTTIANGIGKLKCQLLMSLLGALLKLPVFYVVSIYLNNWSAVVWSNLIVLIPLLITQFCCIIKFLKMRCYDEQCIRYE